MGQKIPDNSAITRANELLLEAIHLLDDAGCHVAAAHVSLAVDLTSQFFNFDTEVANLPEDASFISPSWGNLVSRQVSGE